MGDTIILGRDRGTNSKDRLMAIDYTGNVLWTISSLSVKKLKKLTDGLIALSGKSVYKLTAQGAIEWERDLSFMSAVDIIPTKDNGVAIIGSKDQLVSLLKLDASGNIEWEQVYEEGDGTTLLELENGGYALLARDKKNTYFLKTDELGQINRPLQRENQEAGLMDINNIETVFYANGLQFYDEKNIFHQEEAQYEVPAKSGKSTLFAGGLWIGGLDEEKELHMAAQTFLGEQDFQAGPINDSTGFYNNVWSIDETVVKSFKLDLADSTIDQPIPLSVLHYPGLQNPHVLDQNGNQFIIDVPFAPFVDVNSDNIYNPKDGDYPDVKGDKMLLWIMNDKKEHEESGGLPLEVEIYCKAYAYDGVSNDEVLHNTLFFEASIHNRSNNDYHDLYLGQWINFEIGCPSEDGDFIGSNEENDFFYAYHGDDLDDDDSPFCEQPYGSELPVQTVTLLNQPLTSFSYYLTPFAINPT